MGGVQIVTELAERITRLFDETGASQVERYCALDVARALVSVSDASLFIPSSSSSDSALEGPPESV
jgi:hypothetical protein